MNHKHSRIVIPFVLLLFIIGLPSSIQAQAKKEITELSRDLRSKNQETVRAALWRSAEIGSKASSLVPVLLQLLKTHDEFWLNTDTAFALGRIGGPALPALREILLGGDRRQQYFAIVALGEAPAGERTRAAEILLEAVGAGLHSSSAMYALGSLEMEAVAPVRRFVSRLHQASGRQANDSRTLVMNSLSRMGSVGRDLLNVWLEFDNRRCKAISALMQYPPTDRLLSYLRKFARRGDPASRRCIARASSLQAATQSALRELLLTMIRTSDDRELHRAALSSLANVENLSPRQSKELIALMREEGPGDLGWLYFNVLTNQRRPPRALLPHLERRIKKESGRFHSIRGLGHYGATYPEQRDPVLALLKFDGLNLDHRLYVIATLGRLGPSALPSLLRILRDGSPQERARALGVLAEIGTGASDLAQEVAQLCSDPESGVRLEALFAHYRISGAENIARDIAPFFGDPDERLRNRAAVLAGKLGDAAESLLPQLKTMIREHGHCSAVIAASRIRPAALSDPALRRPVLTCIRIAILREDEWQKESDRLQALALADALGDDVRSLRPYLKYATADFDPSLGRRASSVLAQLE